MDKVVLITGASSGIGRSVAYLFASKGYRLILVGRRQDRLLSIAEEIETQYQTIVQILCLDIRSSDEVRQKFAEIDLNRFPNIDVLINNAGLAAGFGPIDEGKLDDWDLMIDTNLKGLLYVTRETSLRMKNQGFGHIINIGSTAGKEVYPNGNVYCATKHAVDALNQSMRIDLLPYGIKVTAIHPGACETEFALVRFKGDSEKAKAVYDGFTPLYPDDIAQTILYVAELPPNVCINDLTMTCLSQANANHLLRKKS
ncbi:MAG TPA: NAD(P)-dependent oxidoreductase [Chitinophagaceae bacterium]|nr:NAD(P)-dependent oxidoreductase [Chitinophagaceae bacterium]